MRNVLQLPRLPIPALEDTARRYATAMLPLKQPNRIKEHTDKFDHFVATTGPKMQQILKETDAAAASRGVYPHSYIERLWDDGYLCFRGPSPVNIAPAFAMKSLAAATAPLAESAGVDQQSATAAAFLTRAARFAFKVQSNQLDVDGD